MRIVIDLQGAQTESRFRGIGRYSLSLAKAIARNRGAHEIIIALNGLFPETIEPIRAAFYELIPQENIRIWNTLGPTRYTDPNSYLNRQIAERLRESFLHCLRPDVVLVTSIFEGWGDDAVTSIGEFDKRTPVAVILYDLIPLISPDAHFKSSKIYQNYYYQKISSIERSNLLLAISNSAKQEAEATLEFHSDNIVSISAGYDTSFNKIDISGTDTKEACIRYGIKKPFIMYTGGADERKNLKRLIIAFSRTPEEIRKNNQLVFVGKMPTSHVSDFIKTGIKYGLKKSEIIFTGYVEDKDLRILYNSCKLFVFPSLHEGFGIPPLEAMACGAPVIAANTTSLPEVIGFDDALFDPQSIESICEKMMQALTNDTFRESLIAHGLAHVKTFSWDASAIRAIKAMERFSLSTEIGSSSLVIENTSVFKKRNSRILLIKLDHMGDFILAIPAISKLKARYPYANIDVIVGSWNVDIARSLNIFDSIYVFDYFKTKSLLPPLANDRKLAELLEKLGRYDIAIDLRRQADTRFLLAKINTKLRVGYDSFNDEINSWIDILIHSSPDIPFEATQQNRTSIAIQMLKIIDELPYDINDFVTLPEHKKCDMSEGTAVAIFPNAGNDIKEWGKSNFRSLTELLLKDSHIDAVNLYFANNEEADIFKTISDKKLHIHTGLKFYELTQSLISNNVCVANNSFGAHIASYLGLVTIAIYAGHETVDEWKPVFGNSYVIHSNAQCSPCHIPSRSNCGYDMQCLTNITVDIVYSRVIEALQSIKSNTGYHDLILEVSRNRSPDEIVNDLINSIADLDLSKMDEYRKIKIAQYIASNCSPQISTKEIFVDVSEIVNTDAKTGIQRVVRSFLKELLDHPPEGFNVSPVYATTEHSYRYAHHFTNEFIGYTQASDNDEPIETHAGDIFLGLDPHPAVTHSQQDFFHRLRRDGVYVYFIVYDLLTVRHPEWFPSGSKEAFTLWLNVITQADGAICISQSTADDLSAWMEESNIQIKRPYQISVSHIGADVDNSAPSFGMPDDAEDVLLALRNYTSFLMVGTLEPRKGHAQTLAAFELLWDEGYEINLVIVGKSGWMVEELIEKLHHHPALGKRLFWLDVISDEYLKKVYTSSSCLIAASNGEGFGLPLIEAAQYNIPVIARSIPVFYEVAGQHAFYFSGKLPHNLAKAIIEWLELYNSNKHPKSDDMPWLTWKESVNQIKNIVVYGNHDKAAKQ